MRQQSLPHSVAFGAVAGAIALAYEAIGLYGLAVFALPLLLIRRTMAADLGHTPKSTHKLGEAAETIRSPPPSGPHRRPAGPLPVRRRA